MNWARSQVGRRQAATLLIAGSTPAAPSNIARYVMPHAGFVVQFETHFLIQRIDMDARLNPGFPLGRG